MKYLLNITSCPDCSSALTPRCASNICTSGAYVASMVEFVATSDSSILSSPATAQAHVFAPVLGFWQVLAQPLEQPSLVGPLLPPVSKVASGNYAPNPTSAHKDSLSFGIGFTAIPAHF